jgi:hypothetical protein
MTIIPDTKNWTWVLERRCPDCGFDASSFPCLDVAAALRQNAAAWPDLLSLPSARMRPTEQQWSTLEYACHVRDVFRLFDKRLELMVENDDPLFENWDQDRTAVESRYEEQDPERVAAELQAAAAALAERFDAVAQSSWSRTGRRSDGAEFTVDSFSRYLLHDPVHHLHDVNTGLHVLGETA